MFLHALFAQFFFVPLVLQYLGNDLGYSFKPLQQSHDKSYKL